MNTETLVETASDSKNVMLEFFRKYLIDVIVFIVLLVYVAKTIASVGVADKSVLAIIADASLAFVFANLISELLRKQGVMRGESSKIYIATMNEYGKIIEEITACIEKLDEWCAKRNERNQKTAVTQLLLSFGIGYDSFIAGIQNPDENEHKAIKKVRRLRVHKYTTYELVSEIGSGAEKFSLGITKQEYLKKSSFSGAIIAVICSLIFGYFTLDLIQSFSWGAFIWACAQSAFFLIKGVISYFQAFMFTTDSHRNRIILKTNLLYEFKNEILKEQKENGEHLLQKTKDNGNENGRYLEEKQSVVQSKADNVLLSDSTNVQSVQTDINADVV